MRLILPLAGIAVGVTGLAIDAAVIFSSPGAPGARASFIETFVTFWTYFTHLTNLWLVVCYLAQLVRWPMLDWFRRPTMLASAAALIALVMLFYHFMLAPYLRMEGVLLLASYLLHYVAPLLFLGWWATFAAHGGLKIRQIPLMLLPGVAYIVWVLVRGAVAGAYPYDILDVSKIGYVGVGIGVMGLLVAVAALCALLVAADGLIARRRGRTT